MLAVLTFARSESLRSKPFLSSLERESHTGPSFKLVDDGVEGPAARARFAVRCFSFFVTLALRLSRVSLIGS